MQQTEHQQVGMKYGALVMMDALGFRGIWTRQQPTEVISMLCQLRDRVRGALQSQEDEARTRKNVAIDSIRAEFLSDTVVIGVTFKRYFEHGGDRPYTAVMLGIAARVAAQVMGEAAIAAVPLAYRGVITVGDFILKENFIIGPAVDEAAEFMNSAQGAFVYLAPSGFAAVADASRWSAHLRPMGLVRYRVPLKRGEPVESYVVTPFDPASQAHERDAAIEGLRRTFEGSDSPDVTEKRQNTVAFLQELQSGTYSRSK